MLILVALFGCSGNDVEGEKSAAKAAAVDRTLTMEELTSILNIDCYKFLVKSEDQRAIKHFKIAMFEAGKEETRIFDTGTSTNHSNGVDYGVSVVIVSIRRLPEVKKMEICLILETADGGSGTMYQLIDDSYGFPNQTRMGNQGQDGLRMGKTVLEAWAGEKGATNQYDENFNKKMLYLEVE